MTMFENREPLSEMEIQQFRAIRKEAGAKIHPETALIHWRWAQVTDPYGIYPYDPEADCVGREYFACSPESDIWVDFGDLPKATVDALWKRVDSPKLGDGWIDADFLF